MTDESNLSAIRNAALRAILENAVDAIITINESGMITSANPATQTLFGYATEALVGNNVKMLMPSPYQEEHDGYLNRYQSTGIRKIIGTGREVVGKHRDGSTFPIHLAVHEFEVEGERFFAGVIRDFSDLKERQARLEAILESAVDAVVTIDECGLIESANPATQKMFGYEVNDLIGQNVNMLMPNPYRDEHDGYLRNYLQSGEKKIIGIGREVVGQRKDGTVFPMHLAVSEIKIGNRRLFTGTVRDISDVKAAEKKLAEMNEELEERVRQRTAELRAAQVELVRSEKFATLGKVSGGIAHEIRNPLNAVKTSAYYLLNAKNASPEKVREHLGRIDRQVSLIDNVITALSDVAKLPDANLIPTEMAPLLKSTFKSIGLPDNIDAILELSDTESVVMADPNQIVIAFKNLIRNARDAMPEGGVITIKATENETTIDYHVEDTGTGISPENLEKILEPLFTTKARGMGLGLSITRTIVEKNQGTLHVSSAPGKGSRFTIRLLKGTP